jgi:peptidoglycan hydrolase CwlO-like protein
MGEIDKLKKDINLLRQEKTLYQNNLKSLQEDIDRAENEITNLTENIKSSQNTSNMSQNLMLSLKMKNEEDKTNYYKRLT